MKVSFVKLSYPELILRVILGGFGIGLVILGITYPLPEVWLSSLYNTYLVAKFIFGILGIGLFFMSICVGYDLMVVKSVRRRKVESGSKSLHE